MSRQPAAAAAEAAFASYSACYRRDPDRFRASYDDLLPATGLGTAASRAERFGIDLGTGNFWPSSLDVIRARVTTSKSLVDERSSRGTGGQGHLGPARQP